MHEELTRALQRHPRQALGLLPTPIEYMPNITASLGGADLYIKRDDYTGLAFGGNKVRQLEYYIAAAVAQSADTILITGAVQSNFVRLTAAAANKLGLECHIQLEERVAAVDDSYRNSGNVLLDKLLGAKLYSYAEGEDEAGADRRLHDIAGKLRSQGRRPYVIPLAPGHPPLGSLGYVRAAREIAEWELENDLLFDEIVVASGSGHSHAGLLFGLKALASSAFVSGVCVRRDAEKQVPRIASHCQEIAKMLALPSSVTAADIHLEDKFLAPGYGRINTAALQALLMAAQAESVILDPVYTAKTFACFLDRARDTRMRGKNILFIHTGGTPALFAYAQKLQEYL